MNRRQRDDKVMEYKYNLKCFKCVFLKAQKSLTFTSLKKPYIAVDLVLLINRRVIEQFLNIK